MKKYLTNRFEDNIGAEWRTFEQLKEKYGRCLGKSDGDDYSDYIFFWGFSKNNITTLIYVFQVVETIKPNSNRRNIKRNSLDGWKDKVWYEKICKASEQRCFGGIQ